MSDLPGTVAEAADLSTTRPEVLTDEHATTRRVLAALTTSTWAHFACHASADLIAPSRGGLHLHNGVLAIPEISRLRLPHAELAYLSACSTAHGGMRHANEAIHLASAFQLAGFRHVIASLWPLNDTVAATAARGFYRRLAELSPAHALHEVIRDLRVEYPDRPDLWAPLVHSGP